MISLETTTIPTPQPYDAAAPHQQVENLCYVLLQILDQAKANGESLSLSVTELTAAVQSLAFNNQEVQLGALTLRSCGKSLTLEEV